MRVLQFNTVMHNSNQRADDELASYRQKKIMDLFMKKEGEGAE